MMNDAIHQAQHAAPLWKYFALYENKKPNNHTDMKKIILSRVLSMWCLILFLPGMACAQSYLSENKSMKSNILKEDVKYSIYLPKSYQSSEKSYPVLYL